MVLTVFEEQKIINVVREIIKLSTYIVLQNVQSASIHYAVILRLLPSNKEGQCYTPIYQMGGLESDTFLTQITGLLSSPSQTLLEKMVNLIKVHNHYEKLITMVILVPALVISLAQG